MKDGRLQASDLMAGDWVDVRCDAAPNTPHIERITPAHFLRDEIWLTIPITKEILGKNGIFKHKFEGHVEECYSTSANPISNEQFILWEETERFELVLRHIINNLTYSALRCKVKYVHELQHALRICGIDKKIEL